MKINEVRTFFKTLYFALLLFIFAVSLFLFSCTVNTETSGEELNTNTEQVTIELEGKQVIDVKAVSGGYLPESINAKAATPSVLRIKSENSYGCERAFTIPQLKIRATLPINGITEIEIGEFEPGTRLLGTCSMGMYSFYINFN